MSSVRRLRLVQGDITTLAVDAIVNAANVALMPGGGVCGAIHAAAGPELAESCREAGPCATGDVRMTPGFALPARHVIHAVGPVWRGGDADEDKQLASCYRKALDLAAHHGLRTIAFPAISTGIYGFPAERAARIAVREITAALERHPALEEVQCVCFSADTLATYEVACAAQ